MWTKATHDLIDQSFPILCWWIVAVFRPPALLDRISPRWRELFFAEQKSLSRLLLLWGAGLFLLAGYWLPVWNLIMGPQGDNPAIVFSALALLGMGIILMVLALGTYIWREVRSRRT